MESDWTVANTLDVIRTVVLVAAFLVGAVQLYYATRTFRLNALVNFTRLEADLAGKKSKFDEALLDESETGLGLSSEVYREGRDEQRINPEMSFAGAVLTNCRPRRTINGLVRKELERLYPVLGEVRSDAELLYSTTEGRIQHLRRSKALEDYAVVIAALRKSLQWPARSAA